ncbi:hypothetical protein LCM23_12905 [Cytobacillus kochii]|uniref:hypothetical protein n=1 Tax=Cytobacillus kochii TaxID=859143 RepID=UPI001CD418C3|nr:hypothetical protein [Cytobacillus kochii]MCA1026993.1 hypothetical protein [Cytobacillus kochii]
MFDMCNLLKGKVIKEVIKDRVDITIKFTDGTHAYISNDAEIINGDLLLEIDLYDEDGDVIC